MTSSREADRKRYLAERPVFEQLAASIDQRLRELAFEARLDCTVSHRAKDVWSFVKKAVVKQLDDPWNKIYDKAGVRVIVRHPGDLEAAEELIRDNFEVTWSSVEEGAEEDEEEDRLRYPRLHFQVKPRVPLGSPQPFKGYDCEIQLRTAAGDLWASMSHRLLYKPSSQLPKDVRRSLYGLLALVEIYDREVQRAVDVIGQSPDHFTNAVINQCERIFYTFCTNAHNDQLTREAISVIMSTLNSDQQARYPEMLEEFAKRENARLREIYQRYGPASDDYRAGMFVLLGQPESIAIFERLERNTMTLEDAWHQRLPEDLLEEIQRFA